MLARSAGRTRVRAAAALALAVAVFATGCTGGSSGGAAAPAGVPTVPPDPAAAVTLTWWTGQSADAQKVLEGLAKEFSAAHPNVTIKASSGASTTDELLQKLSAGFASNTYPDLSYAFGNWASELGESGHTLDLTPMLDSPELAWSDFAASSRETASVGGRVIGVPAVVGNLGLIYNPKLFDAAGVAYPTDSWTWEDFRSAAKAINNPAQKIYGTAYSVSGSEDTTWHLWPQLWQNGGSILSEDGKTAAFNSAAGVAALDFWRALAIDDTSVYLDQTDEKYGPLFVSGRIGMIITGPWQLYDLGVAKAPYGVSVLPGTNGDHQTSSATDLWVLFDHQDANRAYWAAQFASWLSQGEQDARWNMALGNLPLRASETSTQAFADFVKAYPGADVFVTNLQKNAIHARPTSANYVEVSRYVGKAVGETLLGSKSAQEALDAAAKQANLALAGG